MQHRVLIFSMAAILVFFFFFPEIVSDGAKDGLLLWFQNVLPALLPFLIVSGVIVAMDITTSIGHFLYPVFHILFGISKEGCYPVVIGLLSGYPLGAKTVADLEQTGSISCEEGQLLISFCNNSSPMFLLEYIGLYCMKMSHPLILLLLVDSSAILAAGVGKWWNTKIRKKSRQRRMVSDIVSCEIKNCSPTTSSLSIMEAIDHSILDGFLVMAKVGGYIILFSIVAELVEKVLPMGQLTKTWLLGLLEITTGGEALGKMTNQPLLQWLICAGCCAFGGFSSVAQTASVIQESRLSMAKYCIAKLRHMAVAVMMAFFLYPLL